MRAAWPVRSSRLSFAVLALPLLQGCDRPQDDRICQKPIDEAVAQRLYIDDIPKAPIADRASRRGGYLENCIHKWAYRTARSPDPAPVAAEAAIGACWGALEYYNSATYAVHIAELGAAGRGEEPYLALTKTGKDVTIAQAHYEWAFSQALFHVVQARAGHCAIS